MPDRTISIKVSLDGLQNASADAKGFTTDVQGLGAAAADATAQAAPLGPAIDTAGAALKTTGAAAADIKADFAGIGAASTELTGVLKEKLGPATEGAYAAFEKLAAAETPRALQRGIVDAEIAMEKFQAATKAAEASGTAMPPKVGAAMKAMQTDINAASLKLGELRDRMGDVRTKADSMGQGWSQAAASGGSLNGILNNLEASSTGATQEMARMGLSAIGAFEAFKLGTSIGKELDKGLKEIGIDFSRLGSPVNVASRGITELAGAGISAVGSLAKLGIGGEGLVSWAADASKWLKDARGSMKEFGDVMDPITFKVNALMKVRQAAGKQLLDDVEGLKKLGVAWVDPIAKANQFGQELKLVSDAIEREVLKGGNLTEVARQNAVALDNLRQRLDDEGRSLDSLDPKTRTAILLADGLVAAHNRHSLALKTLREANEQLNPSVVKILETLRLELEAAKKSGNIVTATAEAHQRATIALKAFGDANGLTATEVAKVIAAQSTMLTVTKEATEEGIERQTLALGKLGAGLDDAASKTETAIQQQERLKAATAAANAEFEAQEGLIRSRNKAIDAAIPKNQAWTASLGESTAAAHSESDALGRVAGGLTAVSGAADSATAGLQGVNWAMRHATPATTELTDAQKGLIESLAKVSDQSGLSSLWLGHLVSQLESGQIGLDDFTSKVNDLVNGMKKIGPAAGDTAGLLNKLNSLLSDFKNNSTNGWPTPGGKP